MCVCQFSSKGIEKEAFENNINSTVGFPTKRIRSAVSIDLSFFRQTGVFFSYKSVARDFHKKQVGVALSLSLSLSSLSPL